MNWLFDQTDASSSSKNIYINIEFYIQFFVMISCQSFPHLKTFSRHTTDAPYLVNRSANWWVLSTQCTSILPNFTISESLAIISTLSLRSCITFELFKCSSSDLSVLQNTLGTVFNPKISFVIKATKWFTSAHSPRKHCFWCHWTFTHSF